MKQYLSYFLCLFTSLVFSQEDRTNSYFDINYFKGNIARHNDDILHLIDGHPSGFIASWNKKTFGKKAWQERYGYPDYGVSFAYQDLKNDILGDTYSLYGHANFYFFKRNIILRIGQGLSYSTNPYDRDTNFRNIAYGSRVLSSTYLMLNYKKERLFNRIGLQAGLSLIHNSNANVKAPNTSINSITFNVGLTYNTDETDTDFIQSEEDKKFTQPIKFNAVFRSGINESDVIGSGQFPFYIFSFYADKRINHKSAFQLGTDVFYSNFLKEYIRYRFVAFPEDELEGNEDFKRVGVFAGHELFISKFSVVTQYGYYVYYPFDFEGRTYIRIGLKHYFNDKIFAAMTLKSHAAKAEAVEFGIGIRL
ncbi:acyloxyacyl hydrolase [Spongiivirga citrea]|uniref:Acyloxyacyl hydrolase n=1 Tax=Spongiivirga citrea TaxID=1481457 RepID=A0A6M0CRU3_9FLAO|nr:acyloxyacyl hydrolase [Spongiivirga citrea]NER18814.1 acyloxyacyl hydrolase [Spongiivirga citrea]